MRPPPDEDAHTILLGAGLAGAATAYALARRGHGAGVRVLEREAAPGTHATAQNAAMVRALLDEDGLARWGRAGTCWWRDLPEDLRAPGLFRRTGSILLAEHPPSLTRLRRRVQAARACGLEAEILDGRAARRRWSILEDVPFAVAAFVPDDGVADPVALCARMLQRAEAAGVRISYERAVTRILRRPAAPGAGTPSVRGLAMEDGSEIRCERVVVAAGAWAPQQLERGRCDARGLRPWRRHLAWIGDAATDGLAWGPESPFVWHVDRHAYFRPESGAYLVSACDSVASTPCRPAVADEIDEILHARMAEVFPFLLDLPIRRRWAGLRTYRESHEFTLGAAPELTGLYLACGLGGHGVTCAGPIGEAVAASLLHSPVARPAENLR